MTQLYKRTLDNGQTVYFSQVEKETERGFSTNKRLLLMLEDRFICYLSQHHTNFPLTIDFLNQNAKMVVPLKQLHHIGYPSNRSILVEFWVMIDGTRTKKKWVLNVDSPQLLSAWQEIFDDYSNRSRKATLQGGNLGKEVPGSYQGNVYDSIAKLKGKSPPNNIQNLQAQLTEEVLQSERLLKNDLSESYFANRHFITTPSSRFQAMTPKSQSQLNVFGQNLRFSEPNLVKNISKQFDPQISLQARFKHYLRPNLEELFQIQRSTVWIQNFIEVDNKYIDFLEYSKHIFASLVENNLYEILRKSSLKGSQQKISISSGLIRYEEIQDVIIQIGLTELKSAGGKAYVCDQAASKRIKADFKNLNYLHEIISKDHVLSKSFFIPMACLVTYKGFTGMVSSKVDPSFQTTFYEPPTSDAKSSADLFQRLSDLTKMDFSTFQEPQRIEFLPINVHKNKFLIVHAKSFMPELQPELPIRKEAFLSILQEGETMLAGGSRRDLEKQNIRIAQNMLLKIRQLSELMNKLEVYPLTPFDLAPIFHSYGLNMKYLAKVHTNLSQPYIQGILKTQAAIRSFKALFRRKMQQTISSRGSKAAQEAARQLLNAITGIGQDSAQLWKVVSLHCQKYFSLSVSPEEMNRGYFLLGLCHQLSVDIFPSTSNIQNMFKLKVFVEGLRFVPQVQGPNVLPSFLKTFETSIDSNFKSSQFNKLLISLHLEQFPFPYMIRTNTHLHSKLLWFLSFYVNPKENRFPQLEIYNLQRPSLRQLNGPYLQRRLTQLRWQIKSNSHREHILLLIDKLKETVQDYYGVCHPFISDILQLKALYHLEMGQSTLATQTNKESLSNMVQCCGNNQKHLKLSNSQYHIAECLVKCGKHNEALQHYRKAKNILEVNNYQKQPEYAHILHKIGRITLAQHKDNQSYQCFLQAVRIYQTDDLYSNWDSLVELYQLIPRCQVKVLSQSAYNLYGLRLAEHCSKQLQKVLSVELEYELCSDRQFVRVLKVISEQFIAKLRKEDKAAFRDYLLQVCDFMVMTSDPHEVRLKQAVLYFKRHIADGIFLSAFQNYVSRAGQLVSRLIQERGGRLVISRNQEVDGFDKFFKALVNLTGQTFVLNSIK